MAKKHKAAPMVEEISDFEALELAVRELCIEKGLFTADDHRAWTEYMHTLGPLPAARLVAKAWLDPQDNGSTACRPISARQVITVTCACWKIHPS